MSPLTGESPDGYLDIETHFINGQRFRWVIEVSRSTAKYRTVFLVDDCEIQGLQNWLTLLQQARTAQIALSQVSP